MTYEGKQLPPEVPEVPSEPEAEKPANDQPSIGKRIAAGQTGEKIPAGSGT